MIHAVGPKKLYDVVTELWKKGTRGILLSGGFTKDGRLPVTRAYLEVIEKLKKELDIVFSIHSGLVDRETIDELWSHGIDYIDFEIPPSQRYLAETKNLPHHNIDNYLDILEYALGYDREFIVPHIVIASKTATVQEEKTVIDRITQYDPARTTILVEIPMKHGEPIDIDRVVKTIKYTRLRNRGETILGCMRPQWIKNTLDSIVVREDLVDRIAVPARSVLSRYCIETIYACCSIPVKYINRFPKTKSPGCREGFGVSK